MQHGLKPSEYFKPSICIPTQPEQQGNAAKLQDLKCSITVKNKGQLQKAVGQIGKGSKKFYDRNVSALNEFSNKFKGLDRAVNIIENIAGLKRLLIRPSCTRFISTIGVSSSKTMALNLYILTPFVSQLSGGIPALMQHWQRNSSSHHPHSTGTCGRSKPL